MFIKLQSAKPHFCSKFGNSYMNGNLSHGQAQHEVKFIKYDLGGKSKHFQIDTDLKQAVLHISSKLGDLSLNGSYVIARARGWVIHGGTDGCTRRHMLTMTISGGETGLGQKKWWRFFVIDSKCYMGCLSDVLKDVVQNGRRSLKKSPGISSVLYYLMWFIIYVLIICPRKGGFVESLGATIQCCCSSHTASFPFQC